MSTQAIRNIIRINISRVLPIVKQKVREEGEKKLMEYIEKLQDPEEVKKMLESVIGDDTCSPEGRDKLHEKAEMIKKFLDDVEEIVIKVSDTIEKLADKIRFLTDKIPKPPTAEELMEDAGFNPIEKIDKIIETIQPILDILQKIIMIAPKILAASSGPAANGAIISQTTNALNDAKATINEYVNLFNTVPRLIDQYKNQAMGIADNILEIQGYVNEGLEKINQLRLYIIYLETKFESDCNDFLDQENPPGSEAQPPLVPTPLTLEDIILQFETEYENLLNSLTLQGDQIAIRRVFVLGEDFQKIKNKIGDIKYTSVKKINPGSPISPPGGLGGIVSKSIPYNNDDTPSSPNTNTGNAGNMTTGY